MSASKIVYRKTAAGLAEMQARRLDLPRKTFSMGEAHEKRFYVEARRIR